MIQSTLPGTVVTNLDEFKDRQSFLTLQLPRNLSPRCPLFPSSRCAAHSTSWSLVFISVDSNSENFESMSRVPAGLPTNPRARLARSQTPEIPRRQPEQPPRSLRSASSTRTRAAPAVRDRVQDTAQRVYQSRPPVDETRRVRRSGGSASTTSSSSSGSSFWERGSTSSRSSTTTLPSNEDVGYKEVGRGEVMKDERCENRSRKLAGIEVFFAAPLSVIPTQVSFGLASPKPLPP